MWVKLKDCKTGDMVKAGFLGHKNPEDPSDFDWREIYKIKYEDNDQVYVAIQGWKGKRLSCNTMLYRQQAPCGKD